MTQPIFEVKINQSECDYCLECTEICTCYVHNIIQDIIKHNPQDCTRCESCSDICDAITTRFIT